MRVRNSRCLRALNSNSAARATTRAPCPRVAASLSLAQCALARPLATPLAPTPAAHSLLLAASTQHPPFTVVILRNTFPTPWSTSTSNKSSSTPSQALPRTLFGPAATPSTSSMCPALPTSLSRSTSATLPPHLLLVAVKTSLSVLSRSRHDSRSSSSKMESRQRQKTDLARPALTGYPCNLVVVK